MSGWLQFDAELMSRDFNQVPCPFNHRLHESPLFELPRLARLGDTLFERGGKRDVYNAAAGKSFGEHFAKNGERGLTPGEAILDVETSNSWVVLKRIEQDPDYRVLVDQCVDELAAAIPAFERRHVRSAEGFIFVTSPRAITPYHIDPQWSFMAQISGKKTYRIYDIGEEGAISDEEIEDYYAGNVMAARFDPRHKAKMRTFDLVPGRAVSQPLHAPHSAEVLDEVSIGISIAIVSDTWSDRVLLHTINRRLRQLGLKPKPVGTSDVRDRVKVTAYRAAASAVKAGRRLAGGRSEATERQIDR